MARPNRRRGKPNSSKLPPGIFKTDFKDKTFASVNVEAVDQTAAVQRAQRTLRLTLDVINFYADLSYTRDVRAFVYPVGERESAAVLSPIYQQDRQFSMPGSREGPLKRFVLRDLRSRRARDLGAPKIFQWLGNNQRSAFEQRVLTALQWVGRATADDRCEEAFLLYLISLESLILGEKADRELGYRLKTPLRAAPRPHARAPRGDRRPNQRTLWHQEQDRPRWPDGGER